MMHNAEEYTVSVRKERVDGEIYWVARVDEIPDILEFADTRDEAYQLAIDTITVGQEMCLNEGTPFPSPKHFLEQEVSGRVTLRLPKSVHYKCIVESEKEGSSLNAYILTCIASYTGNKQTPDIYAYGKDLVNQLEFALNNSRPRAVMINEEFSFAQIKTGMVSNVTFREPHKELPLSCRDVAASFNKGRFHNA